MAREWSNRELQPEPNEVAAEMLLWQDDYLDLDDVAEDFGGDEDYSLAEQFAGELTLEAWARLMVPGLANRRLAA